MQRPRIVIMGPPGSGKSTQVEILAEKLHVPYLSTGDLLRQIAKTPGPLGQEVKKYQDQGEIVPDDLTLQLIETVITKEEYQNGYVGEGFPRTMAQAEAMNRLIDQVIYISISDSLVTQRLLSRLICPKCGATFNTLTQPPKVTSVCDHCQTKLINRSDDTNLVIINRLKIYHQTTEPIIDYFRSKQKLLVVDGRPNIETVNKQIFTLAKTTKATALPPMSHRGFSKGSPYKM